MIKYSLLLYICAIWSISLQSQVLGFENTVPSPPEMTCSKGDKIHLSSSHYKKGEQSLEWNFCPNGTLYIKADSTFVLSPKLEEKYGIQLWIYNEDLKQDSLSFEFLSPEGQVSYHFAFRLSAIGWRACWINFRQMRGNKQFKEIAGFRIIAPNRRGRIFLDRLTFPTKTYNLRTTPDMQMPYNNSLMFRDLWHWCRTWQWEQYEYDLPLDDSLTELEQNELQDIESRLTKMLDTPKVIDSKIAQAYNMFHKANIHHCDEGYVGAPLVAQDDDFNAAQGDISLDDLETMLSGFAYDAYYNHSKIAQKHYLEVWNYAIDQGFAYGSGMGTNHHYGYQVKDIYTTAWLMRKIIKAASNGKDIISTLQYWSALQETRKPCASGRDELLDSWHTLLLPKIVAALLFDDKREKSRAMKGLSRWVSTSLNYTNGTIGGIKIDGTSFHHGGFYPAYTIGALAEVSKFAYLTRGTKYLPTKRARLVLKSALLTMRNYCNMYEWGIGICGRHPFGNYHMGQEDIAAFAYLALAGDLSDEGRDFDYQLAADYLRLCPHHTPEADFFKSKGITPARAPQGFFVYNYGSTGIFRRNNWMVTLKGYTTDVWGAEIYAGDNRYGRYQSYGSIQIQGYPSYKESGYNENGWDWNRLPGTTTIHLPLDLLNSPLPGATMAHSKENFSGSSSLANENGMFSMKLMERNLKNFTKDFVARKSAFCFENRIICLGSGIKNSNSLYPTETTLFQSTFQPQKSQIIFNKDTIRHIDFRGEGMANTDSVQCLKDSYENYYYVKNGHVKVQVAEQRSRHNKTHKPTTGTFASAWIDHGVSPNNASYEYMIWIQPSQKELNTYQPLATYRTLRHDNAAHIVYDCLTSTTAYAVFDSISLSKDELFSYIPAETMIMRRQDDSGIRISVCDPNLNIKEKTFTTNEPSRSIQKTLILKGRWEIEKPNNHVNTVHDKYYTRLIVNCQHGQPVEFHLCRH